MFSVFIETDGQNTNEAHFFRTLIARLQLESHLKSIITVGGIIHWKNIEINILRNKDEGVKNLIVFDADFPANNGGFQSRVREIQNRLNHLDPNASFFLMPNHHDDGDFESLLEKCVPEKHRGLLDCFENYLECSSRLSAINGFEYERPNRKAKMYSYISSFARSRSNRERFKNEGDWDFENIEYWDLDASVLNPLKAFFLQNA